MKYFVYAICIIIFAGLQAALFTELPIWRVAPNLLMLFTIFVAAKSEGYEFVFVALIAGIFSDMMTGLPAGSFMLGYVLLGLIVNAVFNWLITLNFDWKYVPAAALGGVALLQIWLFGFAQLAQRVAANAVTVDITTALSRILPLLFVTALAMYPMYWFSDSLVQFLKRFEMRKKGVGV